MKRKSIKRVKTSLLERSFSIAKLGVQVGVQYASYKIAKTDLDTHLVDQARILTKEFGQLKGSIMKAGQMLSVYGEYFLPPQANLILKKLQAESPPIEWSYIEKYLKKYLGTDLFLELEVDPNPIGAASIGQVHLATIKKTKEQIALKIQYPGLEKAIQSDLKSLKNILSLSKILPSNIDLSVVFSEIKSMLHQELNYEREAELTEKYAELLKDDLRYKVPKVYRRYSNKKVLATEFVEGHKIDGPEVSNLSQKRRDDLAANFLYLFFKEIFEWNLVQTDPHLGNYKIHINENEKDRLILLDFGATETFEKNFINSYRRMIKGSVLKDDDLFIAAAQELGFIIKNDTQEYITAFKKLCYDIVEPYHEAPDQTYDWKRSDLLGRVFKQALRFKNFDLRTPPKNLLFLDRKTAGVYIFMSVLKSQINPRTIIDPFLKKVE